MLEHFCKLLHPVLQIIHILCVITVGAHAQTQLQQRKHFRDNDIRFIMI